MPIYLTESDVTALLMMPEAISALDQSFRAQARGDAVNQPRRRLYLPHGTYHSMTAADLSLQTYGQKTYSSFGRTTRFLFLLHDANSGDLLAIMAADRLGQVRTGAATGVAASLLARDSPGLRVGIYGAGWQARSQLEAVCAVRDAARITVYSRSADTRAQFCREMAEHLGRPVEAADRPEDAAREQDIVITATTARDPVLRGEWLSPGVFVSAVGSNMLMKREIDETVVSRSDVIVVDSVEQSRIEAGDLLPAIERRIVRWEQIRELHEIVSGAHPGRTGAEQIILFKSNGIALEDVAVATLVYRKARERGAGVNVPMWTD